MICHIMKGYKMSGDEMQCHIQEMKFCDMTLRPVI